MASLDVLNRLPSAFDLVESSTGVMALRRECAEDLRRAGWSVDSDGDVTAAAMSGRKPMRVLTTASGDMVVRRFTHGGLLRWLTRERFLDAERPFRELLLSEELRSVGIDTPLVVAARARHDGAIGWTLDLVTRRVPECVDGGELLARASANSTRLWRSATFGRVGAFVRRVHDLGFLHADLHPKNLLISESVFHGGEGRIWLIDLDRSVRRPRLSDVERCANLRRLMRYVWRRRERREFVFSRSDALRFLRGYEPDRELRRETARSVAHAHAATERWHRLGWALEGRRTTQ